MILSDQTLREMIESGRLVVKPLQKESIQPASIDCHLSSHYLAVEDRKMHAIDLDSPISYRRLDGEEITIPPHSFLLATTEEYIKVPQQSDGICRGSKLYWSHGSFYSKCGLGGPWF